MRVIKQIDFTAVVAGGAAAATERKALPENLVAIWASINQDETPAGASTVITQNLHADGTTYVSQQTVATGTTGNVDGTHFVLGDPTNGLAVPVTHVLLSYEPHGSNETTFVFKVLCLVEEN